MFPHRSEICSLPQKHVCHRILHQRCVCADLSRNHLHHASLSNLDLRSDIHFATLVLIRYNNLAEPARRFLFSEEDLSYYGLFLCIIIIILSVRPLHRCILRQMPNSNGSEVLRYYPLLLKCNVLNVLINLYVRAC